MDGEEEQHAALLCAIPRASWLTQSITGVHRSELRQLASL